MAEKGIRVKCQGRTFCPRCDQAPFASLRRHRGRIGPGDAAQPTDPPRPFVQNCIGPRCPVCPIFRKFEKDGMHPPRRDRLAFFPVRQWTLPGYGEDHPVHRKAWIQANPNASRNIEGRRPILPEVFTARPGGGTGDLSISARVGGSFNWFDSIDGLCFYIFFP